MNIGVMSHPHIVPFWAVYVYHSHHIFFCFLVIQPKNDLGKAPKVFWHVFMGNDHLAHFFNHLAEKTSTLHHRNNCMSG